MPSSARTSGRRKTGSIARGSPSDVGLLLGSAVMSAAMWFSGFGMLLTLVRQRHAVGCYGVQTGASAIFGFGPNIAFSSKKCLGGYMSEKSAQADYSAAYVEWQRQRDREALEREKFDAEQTSKREAAQQRDEEEQRLALLSRCMPMPIYTRVELRDENFRTAAACIKLVLDTSVEFRRECFGASIDSPQDLDAQQSRYEDRFLAMLELGLIKPIDSTTMLPWAGDCKWSEVSGLLLAYDDFVRFSKNQGVRVENLGALSNEDSSDLSEVGEKSWPYVLAVIAALAHLSGLKSHKVASSVAAVLADSNYPIKEGTVRVYLQKINGLGIFPKGDVPKENYGDVRQGK